MTYVLDCSTAVKWEVNEPDSSKAIRLRDECRNGTLELLVPDIFPLEVANALYTAEMKGNIAPGRFEHRLADILAVGAIVYQSTSLLPRAARIIRQSAGVRIAIYDCLYVALADREGCEFITADDKLIRALQHAYPCIVPLSSI